MILRRVMQHVKRQDWFAVLLDFVIVVAGVFLGTQVANWNDALQDRQRERAYLMSVAEDIRSDIVEIDEIVRVSGVRMSALSFLIPAASGVALPDRFPSARGDIVVEPSAPFDEETHGSAGVAAFILTTLEGHRSAYDAMISTGGVALIRNGKVMRAIHDYYAAAATIRDFEDSLGASRTTLVEAQRLNGISPVDQTPASALAVVFAQDVALAAAAKNYWLYTNRHIKLMGDLRAKAVAVIDEIDSEISRATG
jgi:hypothetical protein